MGRTSVDLLRGNVEVDETFIGGVKTGGKRGRGAPGKAYVVIAVESKDQAFGRCRLQVVPKMPRCLASSRLDQCVTPSFSGGGSGVANTMATGSIRDGRPDLDRSSNPAMPLG